MIRRVIEFPSTVGRQTTSDLTASKVLGMDKFPLVAIFSCPILYWFTRVSLVSHVAFSKYAVPCAFDIMPFYLNQLNQNPKNANLMTIW